MALGMTLPAGTTFATALQDGGGPELAVLHVRALAVHAQVRAYGSRPLVVLADSFELTETIDVSAHGDRPGPGARSARDLEGDGTGALVGGAPGSAMAAPPCQADLPGAGGGALEIYARTRISISGYVYADGGAGIAGTCPGRMIATQPDGSGGTIVLQSPVIDNSGRLSATGAPGSDPRGGAPGSDGDGQIIMLFKAKLAAGVTTPLALTQRY
jgi:hypothetical protein